MEEEKQRGAASRLFGGLFKGLWSVSGGSNFKKATDSVAKQTEQSKDRLGNLINETKQSFRTQPTRIETFEEAVARLNLTPERLAARRKELLHMVWVLAPIAMLAFYYALYHFVAGHPLPTFVGVAATVLACAYLFQPLFRIWQLDKRYLGSVQEFLKSGEWLPGSAKGEQE